MLTPCFLKIYAADHETIILYTIKEKKKEKKNSTGKHTEEKESYEFIHMELLK